MNVYDQVHLVAGVTVAIISSDIAVSLSRVWWPLLDAPLVVAVLVRVAVMVCVAGLVLSALNVWPLLLDVYR